MWEDPHRACGKSSIWGLSKQVLPQKCGGLWEQRMVKGSWQTYIHMEYIKHIPVTPLGFPNSLNLCIWLAWFYDLLLPLLLCSYVPSPSSCLCLPTQFVSVICFIFLVVESNVFSIHCSYTLSPFPLLSTVSSAEFQHIHMLTDSHTVLLYERPYHTYASWFLNYLKSVIVSIINHNGLPFHILSWTQMFPDSFPAFLLLGFSKNTE